jgi:hypothetical protein
MVRWDVERMQFSNQADINNQWFTLLQRMLAARESAEGRVIANTFTDTALRANEIRFEYVEVERDRDGRITRERLREEIFTIAGDIDPMFLLGLQVELFFDDVRDRNVFYARIITDERDVIFDVLREVGKVGTGDRDRFRLLGRDAWFNVMTASRDIDPVARLVIFESNQDTEAYEAEDNGDFTSTITIPTTEAGYDNFGKFVLDRGTIAFAVIFNAPSTFAGVVTEVNNNNIRYFVGEGNSRSMNLNDYRAAIILDGQLRTVDADQVDVDSVIYALQNRDRDLFLVAVNNQNEGQMTSVTRGRVTVGGTNINVDRGEAGQAPAGATTVSSDGNDRVENFYDAGVSDAAQDLLGEDVIVMRDYIGRARHIIGATDRVSGEQYGIVYGIFNRSIDMVTQNGDEVTLNIARDADWSGAATSPTSLSTYISGGDLLGLIRYRIDRNGDISEIHVIARTEAGGNIIGESAIDAFNRAGGGVIETVTDGNFLVTSRTVFMAIDGNDPDEIAAVNWSQLRGLDPNTTNAYIHTVGTTSEAAFVVITLDGTTEEDWFFGATTGAADGALVSGSTVWRIPMILAGEGTKRQALRTERAIRHHSIVQFQVNRSDEAISISGFSLGGGGVTTGVTRLVYGDLWEVTNVSRNNVVTLRHNDTGTVQTFTLGDQPALRLVTSTATAVSTVARGEVQEGEFIVFVGSGFDPSASGVARWADTLSIEAAFIYSADRVGPGDEIRWR